MNKEMSETIQYWGLFAALAFCFCYFIGSIRGCQEQADMLSKQRRVEEIRAVSNCIDKLGKPFECREVFK